MLAYRVNRGVSSHVHDSDSYSFFWALVLYRWAALYCLVANKL